MSLGLFPLFEAENDGSGANGEQSAVADDTALSVAENLVVDKGAGITRAVAKDKLHVASLVTPGADVTMGDVHAWVVGPNRAIDACIFHIATYGVLAYGQRDNLLVMKDVFDDVEISARFTLRLFLCGLCVGLFRRAGEADAKALIAVGTGEDKHLPGSIARLIECDVMLAFRTAYPFHLALNIS